ncbi:MAG: type II 3-dehydroquinate dehydratase [Polyangiaceae bacterium]|nr:type II 3-dehydroquinate dehydratase [Polyangiaceae bacterium]
MTTRSRRGAPAVKVRRSAAPRVPPRHRKRGTRLERILVLSGPNLERLGRRQPEIYGTTTLPQIHERLAVAARELGVEVICRQSNHEGQLIDWINAADDDGIAGILINPGALTHTSYALHDSLAGATQPAIEVHLTNPDAREPFRHKSCVAPACVARVSGFGADSYLLALRGLVDRLRAAR